ncbi:MAG: GguC protein, partial [Bryobacteraceae bacterium]
LILDAEFAAVRGSVAIERGGAPVWSKEIATGEAHTLYPLADLERHCFKYESHRLPGDTHVHFLGGSVSSFGDGIRLEQGDEAVIQWEGFGRPLRNSIRRDADTTLDAAIPL